MFRIFRGDQLVREERLAQGVIKVGKVPSAQLRIDDESVSRMHAIIEVTGADVHIVDLGSTRGTFVNGHKVTKARLRTGDSIQLGDSRVELAITDAAASGALMPAISVVAAPVAVPVAVPVAAPRALRLVPPAPPVMPRAAAAAPVVTHVPAAAAPVAPVAVPRAIPPAPSAPFAVPPGPSDAAGSAAGARAIEVATMLGDSVVDVKHCMNPRGGKVTRATWALAAGGLACLLASATAFYASVSTASSNAAALTRHTRELHRPAYSFRPRTLGGAFDGVALGGLALGLGLAVTALVRARSERRSPFYRIGTAPGVEQAVEHAPSESFPLVAPSGDDFVFNYGAGIDGELIVDGTTTSLAELASTGRARPSATTPGALELAIPASARIRARAGQTTFLVSAVARPRPQAAAPVLAGLLESRAMKYVGGSLAAHLGLVLLLSQIPDAEASPAVSLDNREQLSFLSALTGKETQPEKVEEGDTDNGSESDSEQTTGMELPSGTAGDPNQQKAQGTLQIKDNQVSPQLAREQAVEAARTAGILGSTRLMDDITAMTSNQAFSSGFDPANTLGAVDGSTAGMGRGTFGMGVSGDGRGGNCLMPPCGIIGTGNRYTGTIGTGKFAGDGFKFGAGGKGGLRTHVAAAPIYSYPRGIPDGTIDKSIIKRHIKQHEEQIGYCYQKELLANPKLEGTVTIQFLISPTGNVQSSLGEGFDGNIAGCVAGVIKNISFPAPKNGGAVTVNYPFTFRTAG